MPQNSGKDLVCSGCEELRPLLTKFKLSKEDSAAKLEQPWFTVRALFREDALALMRFFKHWPPNANFLHNHVSYLFKTQEDLQALNVITLGFVMLGIQFSATCLAGLERRSKDSDSSRQSSASSSPDSLPDNPTPSSEPDLNRPEPSSSSISPVPPVESEPPSSPAEKERDVIVLSDSPIPPEKEPVASTSRETDNGSASRECLDLAADGVDFSVWSPKELEDFICCFTRVFLPTYPLYVAAKCFVQRDERTKVDNPCPPYYLDTFTYWVTQGGLSFLTNYFTNATAENSSLQDSVLLVTSAFHVRQFVYFEVFTNAIATYRISVINYLLNLPLDEFRKPQCRQIAEMMWNLRKDAAWPHATFDLEGLNLAYKFFSCCSHLTLRLIGIQEINQYLVMFADLATELDARLVVQLGGHIASWILDRHIVEEIFGQNAHVELISRSGQIINFLSQHQCLTVDHVDCLWNAAQTNYISRQVFEMLPNVTRFLEPPLLMHLYKRLGEMETVQHTDHSISVVSTAIRAIWLHAIHQQKPVFPAVQPARHTVEHGRQASSSQEMPVTVPHRTVRIRIGAETSYSESGESERSSESSGSGSEEESNSDGFDSDEEEGQSDRSKIPNISTLYAKKGPVRMRPMSMTQVLQQAVAKVVKPSPAAPHPSSGEGSSGSDEDEDPDGPTTSTPNPNKRIVLQDDKRKKRSPCPSRELSGVKKRLQFPVITTPVRRSSANSSAIMEHLLAPSGSKNSSARSLNSAEVSAILNISPTQEDASFEEMMANDSDGNEAEINSSGSDMSEKMNDIDSDLMDESVPEEGLGDEDDDLDIEIQGSQLASLISSEDVRKLQAFQVQQPRHMVYSTRTREIAYSLDEITQPGKTLLWDLIQDRNSEGLSPLALTCCEKELLQLIQSMNNATITVKFINACIENLSIHQTVSASLRILNRLIQTSPAGHPYDTGSVKPLMACFFEDLKLFAQNPPGNEFQRIVDIRGRLQFLQTVYSTTVTDRKFRLDKDQLEILWDCFVVKLRVIDELAQWLTTQVTGHENHHAMSGPCIQELFYRHLGKLEPQNMSMMAFKLYQICLQNLATIHTEKQQTLRSECADRVWVYAMFGEVDVSELAVRHLNNYYIQAVRANKDSVVNYKEAELVKRSMDYITEAMAQLKTNQSAFTTIIRCFSLMKRQIESYKQRYGFHLRLWQLAGCGVLSHNQAVTMIPHSRSYCFIHASIQIEERPTQNVTLTMAGNQYFGELRADLLVWIWKLSDKQTEERREPRAYLEELYGFVQTRGPVHVIFRNEEIGPDKDEISLHDLCFRQENPIFVNFGGALRKAQKAKDKQPAVFLPPPYRDSVPMLLAASPENFQVFFQLQETLNTLAPDCAGNTERENSRRLVAKHLWDFLMLIPTSGLVLESVCLQPPREQPTVDDWKEILPVDNPHRLLYALQALENLHREPHAHGIGITDLEVTQFWGDKFISSGGFARLYELLLSPELQQGGGMSDVVDHHRECLSNLIRDIFLFSIEPERPKLEEDVQETSESSEDEGEILPGNVAAAATRKRSRSEQKLKAAMKRVRQDSVQQGPRFKRIILELLDTDRVLEALMRIQFNTVMLRDALDQKPNRAARIARQTVVRLAFEFLHGWATCSQQVFPALGKHHFLAEWLRRMALEAADTVIAAETSAFIEKMCRAEPEYELSCSLLVPLVDMMPMAENIKCLRSAGREDKPPLKQSPRHFYEAISKLLEIIPNKYVIEKVDLDALCEQLANSLETRPCFEPRHGNLEDDGLIGLFKVATQVLSHNPNFKFRPAGLKMLLTIYSCLFDQPCDKKRDYPKCKSIAARNAAYSSLFEITRHAAENYITLARHLLKNHAARPLQLWDYWPRDDMRADCGYVGIMNLGATCYMATTMQHLYMIPEARKAIIEALPGDGKPSTALYEMQKMFAFLLESERKAYSPEAFCRAYEMNNQMLNPTEQKDMMEFFSDLVAKMEEMSPSLKQMVKKTFTGTNCNTVISLDCGHVSQTTEEFTTVRCQVNNMRNLYESLNDVCVKDVLEGNNMYKCGQCNREVRAEKQACFRTLPEILVLNTLRYTFNMITMQREKVNTHFTFPVILDMAQYMEENIFKQGDGMSSPDQYKYQLIGVTVHTGTAEGGHYYSFIRDLESGDDDRWYLFNDAEVRQFESDQLGSECFGGEQPKTFDTSGERYLDFGLEKTNSAYMLFYEKIEKLKEKTLSRAIQPVIPKDLQQWVWKDTTEFVQDINIFDRFYFEFLWRLCSGIPSTLSNKEHHYDANLLTGQLTSSFLWETLIHARDRNQLQNFFELTIKLAVATPAVADWFMRQFVEDSRWLMGILVQCPIGNLRHMFQRFIIGLIQRLRTQCPYFELYMHETQGFAWQFLVGKFCRMCIGYLAEQEVRLHWRGLSDMMVILVEFSKQGWAEAWFMVTSNLFPYCYHFYLHLRQMRDVRNPMIGPLPLFPLHSNILEMAMLNTDEPDHSDRFSPDVDKDKPNTLSLMVLLLRQCVEMFQGNVYTCKLHQKEHQPGGIEANFVHSDIEHYMGGITEQEQLDFLGVLIRDGIATIDTARLAAALYFDKPDRARNAVHFLIQKVVDLSSAPVESVLTKKEREREMQIRQHLNATMEMVRTGAGYVGVWTQPAVEATSSTISELSRASPDLVIPAYTDYMLEKLVDLITYAPMQTYQWLTDNFRFEPVQKWVINNLDMILEWHGLSIGKPVSVFREDMQLEVARLIVAMTGETKLRDLFGIGQTAMLFTVNKEKFANIVTAADKMDLLLTDDHHQWITTIIHRVLEYFYALQQKHPTVFDPVLGTESYQWILFALQYLLVDECEKAEIYEFYDLLRNGLLQQLVPEVKIGGNRQAIIQLFAAASNRFPRLSAHIIQDDELISRLLTEVKLRGNEDMGFLENEGRCLSATFHLLHILCVQDGEFAANLAEDPRLLPKLQNAMTLKIHEICRRSLTILLDTLINHAGYPAGRKSGEIFRKALFTSILGMKAQWGSPGANMLNLLIAKKVMDGGEEQFQAFAIENKAMDLLTENFRACSALYQSNKLLTYLVEEINWTVNLLRKYRAFVFQHVETYPTLKDIYQQWTNVAKQIQRDLGVDLLGVVESNGPFDIAPRSVVMPKRR